mgnify:CR=1 FL=1
MGLAKRNNLDNKIKINFRQRNAFVEGATSFLQLFYYNTLSGGGIDLTALDVFPFDYMKDYDGEDYDDEDYDDYDEDEDETDVDDDFAELMAGLSSIAQSIFGDNVSVHIVVE